jgi:hypothetical protein
MLLGEREMKDGIALTSIAHPEGDPVPDDHEINPDSLETVEVEIPMNEKEINEAFDREYEIHSKDPVYRIIRACGLSTANSDINVVALERIVEDIKAAEREACIKLLEDFSNTGMVPVKDTWRMGLIAGANAIRGRTE